MMYRSHSYLFGLLLSCALCEQAFAQLPPDAGQSLRDLQSAPPALPRSTPSIDLQPRQPSAPSHEGPTVQVNAFRLVGNQLFPASRLLPLLADLTQRRLTLSEIQSAADRIAEFYHSHGYPLSLGYVPPQDVSAGVVTLGILEGRYDSILISNHSGVSDSVVRAPLAALERGEPIDGAALQQALLLLDDISGVRAKGTLRPGSSAGTSDLVVDMDPEPAVTGGVQLDNYGNRFTGANRLDAHLDLVNPLGLGDLLTLRGLGSDGDQGYGSIGYQVPVGAWSTRVGASYSRMTYRLGEQFDDLDAHGDADTFSLFVLQPLLRSRAFSLYGRAQYDLKKLDDRIDYYQLDSRKRIHVATLGLGGSGQDRWQGLYSFDIAYAHGVLTLEDASDRLMDRYTAQRAGQFDKLNLSFARLQPLSARWSLYWQLRAPLTDDNLDSAEKFSLGGVYGVRAYPVGEAAADQGWMTNLELRYQFHRYWMAKVFVDHGEVRINTDPWTTGENQRHLSAAGLGLHWQSGNWSADTQVAWKLGNAEPQSDVDRLPRLWGELAWSF